MNFDINNIIRSVAIAAVGLPLSISVSGFVNTTSSVASRTAEKAFDESQVEVVKREYGDKLVKACIGYVVSKADSTLERESKTTIDKIFGGEVNYKSVCDFFVF